MIISLIDFNIILRKLKAKEKNCSPYENLNDHFSRGLPEMNNKLKVKKKKKKIYRTNTSPN